MDISLELKWLPCLNKVYLLTYLLITDSKHNCSRTADLSVAASMDLVLKLRGSADPVPLFHPPLFGSFVIILYI